MTESAESPAAEPDLSTFQARLGLVRALWTEILKVDDVADDIGFFDAGGDSLLLIMLVERLGQVSRRPVKTMDVFRAGTMRGHADLLAAPAEAAAPGSGSGSSRDRLLAAARTRDATPR